MADDRSALLSLSHARTGAGAVAGSIPEDTTPNTSRAMTMGLVAAAVVVGLLMLGSSASSPMGQTSVGTGAESGWYALGYKEADYQRLATFEGPFFTRGEANAAANAMDPPWHARVAHLNRRP